MADRIEWKIDGGICRLVAEEYRGVAVQEHGSHLAVSVRNRDAQLADLSAALTAQGFALVRVVGTEPTDYDLEKLSHDACMAAWRVETVYASQSAGRRALYLAGSASREAEIERLRAERDEHTRQRNAWQSVVDKAEERATTAEARVGELEGALSKINEIRNSIVGYQRVSFSAHIYPLVASLNEAGFHSESYDVARAKAQTQVERIAELEAELARVRAELIETDKALKECQDWHLDACNKRDEARAKLAECELDLASERRLLEEASRTMAENCRLRSQLESHRAVVEAATRYRAALKDNEQTETRAEWFAIRGTFFAAVDAISASEPTGKAEADKTIGKGDRVVVNNSRPRFAGHRGEVIFAEGKSARVRLDGNVDPDDDVWLVLENIGREPETAEAGPSGEPTKQTKFVPPSSGYPPGSLADEVMRIVFAFNHGDSRRDAVRELASRVSNLEAGQRAEPVAQGVSRERELLARIVKYAREDRARTPGKTRLARALEEAEHLLADAGNR